MEEVSMLYYYSFIALLFAVSVALGKISGPVIVRALEFFSKRTKSTLDDRIIASVKVPLESFFFLIVFYGLLNYFPDLADAAHLLDAYTYAILILMGTFMLSEASGAAIRWYYEEGHKSARVVKVDLSLLPLVRKVTKLAIYIAGLTLALSTTGFDVTAIIAITSVAGLILGLASQETLANIFAGIALQIDRPYHYGDCLKLPTGDIVKLDKIGMRSTKLSDMNHNTVIISNSEFAKLRVTNLSLPDDISLVSVQSELPNTCDLEALKDRIAESLRERKPRGLLAELGFTLSIDQVKPSTVVISHSFWVKDYENAPAIRDIVNKEILAFAQKKR